MSEKVSYAILELVNKDARIQHRDIIDATVKIERGLFKGILLRENEENKEIQKFVMIESLGGIITILNLNTYNIVVLEVLKGRFKEITFYRSVEDDQSAAFEHVANLLAALQTSEMVLSDKEIVDTSKFINLPKDLKDSNVKSLKYGDKNTGNQQSGFQQPVSGIGTPNYNTPPATPYRNSGYGNGYNNNYYNNYNSYSRSGAWVAEKDRKPKAIKRDSKKPSKDFLEKMKKMVISIANGEYEAPPLLKVAPEEETKNTLNQERYEVDEYGYGGVWG